MALADVSVGWVVAKAACNGSKARLNPVAEPGLVRLQQGCPRADHTEAEGGRLTPAWAPAQVLAMFCCLVLIATTFISHTVGAMVILPIVRAVGTDMAVRLPSHMKCNTSAFLVHPRGILPRQPAVEDPSLAAARLPGCQPWLVAATSSTLHPCCFRPLKAPHPAPAAVISKASNMPADR